MINIEYTLPTVPVETNIGEYIISSIYIPEHESYTVLDGVVEINSKEIKNEITEAMRSDTTILIVTTLPTDLNSLESTIIELIVEDLDYIAETKIVCNLEIQNLNLLDGIANCKIVSGKYPIDMFDQYQVSFVDKGSSDKLQTPEVKGIKEVPDGKDVYKVVPDPRASLDISYTVTINSHLGKQEIKTVTQTVTQTFTMIKEWITDYVERRRLL